VVNRFVVSIAGGMLLKEESITTPSVNPQAAEIATEFGDFQDGVRVDRVRQELLAP
jgi:hypothetical protein